LYDSGNLFVGTVDGTAVAWGKLWLEYDVSLFTPQLPPAGVALTGTIQGAGGSIAVATPFGAVPVSTGGFTMTGASTNVLTMVGLQIGAEYCITATYAGAGITVGTLITPVGLTLKSTLLAAPTTAGTTGAAVSTYVATASTASVVLNLTGTSLSASAVVVSGLSPIPAF
jgi:hypothetical protein